MDDPRPCDRKKETINIILGRHYTWENEKLSHRNTRKNNEMRLQ